MLQSHATVVALAVAAATLLQATVRHHLAIQVVAKTAHLRFKNQCATTIQSIWRGKLIYQRFKKQLITRHLAQQAHVLKLLVKKWVAAQVEKSVDSLATDLLRITIGVDSQAMYMDTESSPKKRGRSAEGLTHRMSRRRLARVISWL